MLIRPNNWTSHVEMPEQMLKNLDVRADAHTAPSQGDSRMRKVLTLALVLGAALAIGSAAGVADENAGAPSSSVHYEGMGPGFGMLAISGAPGAHFDVFDATGIPVHSGNLNPPPVQFMTGNAGMGPDGAIFHVIVEGDYHAVTEDPNWEWN